MPWATVPDVTTLTGATPTSAQLAMAQAQVEVAAGRREGFAGELDAGDLYWLKLAVAYQAAEVVAEAGSSGALSEVKSLNVDGLAVTLRDDAGGGSEGLADMAAKALGRVSWGGSSTVHTRPFLGGGDPGVVANPLHDGEVLDAAFPWAQLEPDRP